MGPHFTPGADSEHGMVVLKTLLRALTQINEDWLRRIPDLPLLYQSGVRYQREEKGKEEWTDCVETYERGWGDCEDLVCWRVAELRVRYGIREARPDFTLRLLPSENGGPPRRVFHIIVRIGPDREDPSLKLGMGRRDAWMDGAATEED